MAVEVLFVDDDQAMGRLVEGALRRRGFAVTVLADAEAGLAAVLAGEFAAVLTDLNLTGMNGIEFCTRIAAARPELPVVVITAFGSLDTAVQAIRAGAYDFLTKPVDVELLAMTTTRATQLHALRGEVRRLRAAAAGDEPADGMLGKSLAMRRLRDGIVRIAASEANVLVVGETGTGKELVARALHDGSRRRDRAFVAVNCAAIPGALMESELFGHVKGAFTDARGERKGLFQEADGGTLFLDEIGELDLALQPKLLRAVQEQRIRPVGSDRELAVDVRVLAATHRDLDAAVQVERFRQDLLYRLDVVRIDVPALRERGNDVLELAQRFVVDEAARARKKVLGIGAAAAERLLAYPWPGNVRELANAIGRAVALTDYEQITVDDLPEKVRGHKPSHVLVTAEAPVDYVPLAEVERRYIHKVLEAVGGNRTRAAMILGLDRKTLYRRLQEYEARGQAGGAPAPHDDG